MTEDGTGGNEVEALRREHRERMDRIDAWMFRLTDTVRYVAFAVPLAVALVVLTATGWQITRGGRTRNAWEVAYAFGWPGGLVLTLVLLLALGTLVVALRPSLSPWPYRVVAGAGVPVVLAVLLVATFTRGRPEPTAGLWLTAVAAATLVVLHAHRSRVISRTWRAAASR